MSKKPAATSLSIILRSMSRACRRFIGRLVQEYVISTFHFNSPAITRTLKLFSASLSAFFGTMSDRT
ncbi:MAG: hypothetical protein JO161_10855 [Planctomycetaceae bacterium]|nr:hypothetical protein [Planctomycetaceae bacterium]